MPQHIPLEKLFAHQSNQLGRAEETTIRQHLHDCQACSQHAELVARLYSSLNDKNTSIPFSANTSETKNISACPSPEEIGRFMNDELSDDDRQDIEQHLATCDHCRSQLVEIFRLSVAPITEEEQALLGSLPPLEISDQVRKIMDLMPPAPEKPRVFGNVWEGLRHLIPELAIPRPALGFAMVALLAVVGFFTYHGPFRDWRGQVNADAGISGLKESFTMTDDDLRPSVEIPLSKFSQTHSGQGGASADSIADALRRALKWTPENRGAKQGLALYWYFGGNLTAADSLLRAIVAEDSLDFEAWNNLGLLAAQQEDTTAALAAFEKALQIRRDYAPAAFNRAALLQQLGRLAEAKAAWQDYLTYESKPEWIKIAQKRLAAISSS
jgi:hypothetical protein